MDRKAFDLLQARIVKVHNLYPSYSDSDRQKIVDRLGQQGRIHRERDDDEKFAVKIVSMFGVELEICSTKTLDEADLIFNSFVTTIGYARFIQVRRVYVTDLKNGNVLLDTPLCSEA